MHNFRVHVSVLGEHSNSDGTYTPYDNRANGVYDVEADDMESAKSRLVSGLRPLYPCGEFLCTVLSMDGNSIDDEPTYTLGI